MCTVCNRLKELTEEFARSGEFANMQPSMQSKIQRRMLRLVGDWLFESVLEEARKISEEDKKESDMLDEKMRLSWITGAPKW